MQVLSTDECNKIFSSEELEKNPEISRIQLKKKEKLLNRNFTQEISCVGNTFKIENACEGDSGSPVTR